MCLRMVVVAVLAMMASCVARSRETSDHSAWRAKKQVDVLEVDFTQMGSLTAKEVQAWLDGERKSIDGLPLLVYPGRDPWGNTYKCVQRTNGSQSRFEFYSEGNDRKSNSHGDDNDDIASWNRVPEYYMK